MLTLLFGMFVKNTRNSTRKFSTSTQLLNEFCDNMDSEMRECFVGPMPVKEFFENFLPVQLPPARRRRLRGFEAMAGLESEIQMYNAFVRPFHAIFLVPNI